MKRSPVLLAEITLTPKEVVTIVDRLDEEAQQNPKRTPIDIKKPDVEVKGYFEVDLKGAKPAYQSGKLVYGPVKLELFIEYLNLVIDWHGGLHIPKRHCITLLKACGEKLEVCWDWDLGIWRPKLIRNAIFKSSPMLQLLDVSFHDKGDKEGFQLYGDIQLVAALVDLFSTGIARRFNEIVADAVKDFLKGVLGGGEIAKIFISIIMWAFKAVDALISFFQTLLALVLQPLEELLHAIFGKALEIKLTKDPPFPRDLLIMKAEGQHSDVFLKLKTPPQINIGAAGVTLRVLA